MRQIILDTETTGLDPSQGHKIIEIGCIELINRRVSGNRYHKYLNPGREIDEGAAAVHGIRLADLVDKPRFADIADELLGFIAGAELIIHNAPFDIGFLDAELAELPGGRTIGALCRVLDTLSLARELHPGQRNSLDALCKRYGVDNSRRELHGALLDAGILADVYLAMTGGQSALALVEAPAERRSGAAANAKIVRPDGPLKVVAASEAEAAAHEKMLDLIAKSSGGTCLWRTS
jgi:DNA polymerase-3 subunit epsilon